ncbi:MAG: hypothetical protein K2N06_04155 [Oscillospiraceae bacterium]|nr:hypothetical protein [Oscillospiraceae bacterium]
METKSLYDIIHDSSENGTLPRDFSLPPVSDAKIPFADGARDGIAIYHMGAPEITDDIREGIKSAVTAASDEDFKCAGELFHALSEKISAIRAIDELQSFIIENRDSLNAKNLYDCSVHLMTESADRECVKFGMSMLELFNIEGNEKLMKAVELIGLSDEFTIFAVFIMSRWENGNERIFRLAQDVHGWGRIHAVERLEPETDEIHRWLLREGVNNDVLPAYSALTCWEKSGATELLRDSDLSDEDFTGIANLIDALLDEGPCEGISAVENNTEVITGFLKVAQNKNLSIDDYVIIRNIRVKFEDENSEIVAKCGEILSTENCRTCVKSAEKSGIVIPLAEELGIDFKDEVMRQLETDFGKNFYLCWELMGDEYRAKTIEIFRARLQFGRLLATPSDTPLTGGEFQIHNQLNAIVQSLKDYPLEGTDLIEFSLNCGPSQDRHLALNVLQNWVNLRRMPLETLLPEMFTKIRHKIRIEPDDDVREKMEKLLNGEIDE